MSARSRRFRRSKAEAAARKAEAVKSIETRSVWVSKKAYQNGRRTRLYIVKVHENSVTVVNMLHQNQRGLLIEDLLARYTKET